MRIARVGFTPLKGAAHTAYDVLTLDARGPVGDRAFCLVDPVRQRVLRTVQHPSMLGVRSRWDGHSLDVVLPGGDSACGPPAPTGEQLTCDYWGRPARLELQAGPHAALLSSWLGVPVRLAAARRGEVVYGASVTLVSTSSMRELAAWLGRPEVAHETSRFRATVVVDTPDGSPMEDQWLGREVDLGGARVLVRSRVPRCAVVDLCPRTGRRDAPVLQALADHRHRGASGDLFFGVDAEVTVPGTVRPGDVVRVAPA